MSGRQLTRDELEDRLDSLEAAVEDLRADRDHLSKQIAQDRARMVELEEENEQLRETVADLRSRVDPDPTGKDYDEMDRGERVFRVRVALARKAAKSNGRATYRYDDVLSQFDQRPSAGYAYTLLEIAGEADGYRYGEHNGEKQLRVNLDAVNDDAVFHAVNNEKRGEGGK
jgi:regulator of replication initiation timing